MSSKPSIIRFRPNSGDNVKARLTEDYLRFRDGSPENIEAYVLETYGVSLSSTYANQPIRNPFGKASGQLSLTPKQIERDAEAGLGFAVLKTVIAQDEAGSQSMKAWAIPATHMKVEPIVGKRPAVMGEQGWTVTWKGRGWSESFEKYLEFFSNSIEIGSAAGMLVVPSVKYHLPRPEESGWRTGEYEFTTKRLYDVWRRQTETPMPIEKDFSPTLAGDLSFSRERATVIQWLRTVPALLRTTCVGKDLRIGLKLFNAAHSDEFQVEMLSAVLGAMGAEKPDFIIYGNRLFDPERSYEGVQGVAYGGPDLSDRNLETLSRVACTIPLCATGNILTGKMAFEYLRRGATTFQLHTLFQLPDSEFEMRQGSRIERAMHRLLFHPKHGFLASLLAARVELGLGEGHDIPYFAKAIQDAENARN
jgi:hypothetical protein